MGAPKPRRWVRATSETECCAGRSIQLLGAEFADRDSRERGVLHIVDITECSCGKDTRCFGGEKNWNLFTCWPGLLWMLFSFFRISSSSMDSLIPSWLIRNANSYRAYEKSDLSTPSTTEQCILMYPIIFVYHLSFYFNVCFLQSFLLLRQTIWIKFTTLVSSTILIWSCMLLWVRWTSGP